MKWRKYLCLILLLSLGICGQTFQDARSSPPRIIQAASEPDYPPYCIINNAGEADGFSVELFRAAAEAVNLKPEIQIGYWNEIKQQLIDGTIDALPMVGRTRKRDKVLDFTFPYHSMSGALFVRKGTTSIKTLDDVKNYTVEVMQGDTSHDFVIEYGIADSLITTSTFDTAFTDLHNGRCDVVISQKVMGMQLVDKLGYSDIYPLNIALEGFSQDFSFAVTEGDKELLMLLNEGLAIVIADGTFDRLHHKWWSPLEEYNLSWLRLIVMLLPWLAGFVILTSGIAIIILNRKVRSRTAHLQQEIEEHKSVKNKLTRSENRFRILFKSNPMSMFLWSHVNDQFIFIDYNTISEQTINHDPSAYLKKPIDEIFRDRPDLIDAVKQCYRQNKEITFETDFTSTITNDQYILRFRFLRVSDDLVLMMFQDITKSSQMLDEVKTSEEKYRLLINQMNQGLAVHQAVFNESGKMVDYRFLHCNKSFERITGLKREHILGKTVHEVMPDTEEYWLELYEKVVKTGTPVRYSNFSGELGRYYDVTAYRNQRHQFAVIITDETERQETIKKLRESQRRLSLSLQSTHASVFEINLQTNSVFFTPDLFTLLGYTPEQTPASLEDCKALFHPDERNSFDEAIQFLKDNQSNEFTSENRVKTEYGQWRWIETTGRLLEGHLLVGISRDIHQQKTAQERLKESEEQFRFLSSATFEGIVIHKRGIILDVNDSFCAITGYLRDECLGKNLLSYIPSAKDRAKIMLNIVKHTAKPYLITARRKNGEPFITELEAKDVLFKGKTVRIAAVRDVTEREHAARELVESEQRFNLVLQAADIGFWDINLKDDIAVFSDRWLEIGGYTSGEINPSIESLRKQIHPDDHERVVELFRNHVQGKTPIYNAEFRIKTKSGAWLWVLDRGRVMQFDDSGHPLRALGTRQDINNRKLAEQQVHDLLEEKDILLREVHHRIKNNMATIETMLKIQSHNSELMDVKNALDDANSRLKSMRVLYDKLYRSDTFDEISIKRYFLHLVNEITTLFPQSSKLNIQMDFGEFTIPTKSIFHLGIILNELLTNAMKYAFPDITPQSTIKIAATRKGTEVIIEIVDNGTGMPQGFSIAQSTGFGMQLVHLLTQQNNGIVELIPDQGTHWRLTFPIEG